MSSGSKKRELRYTCLSEAKASHSQKMWAEVPSSAPHKGLPVSPIKWICLLRVLRKVRLRKITLNWVLLKDKDLVCAAGLGPEINYRAYLWVLLRPRHIDKCWLSTQHFVFLLIFCLQNPKNSSGPTNVSTEPSLASFSVISFPCTPAWSGT
jgi:hypothetical protein